MSESTKALHQAASTLKKNPGRVDRLVKEAALRIVPAGRYASGKAKEMAEAAIKKLKEPKGFGGADLSTKSTKFFKEASDKSKEVAAVGGTAASGGLVSAVLANDRAKARVSSHDANKSFNAMKKGSPIERNLAASAKRARRLAPAVKKVTGRAGAVGALAGAALGALSMKKEAAAKDVKEAVGKTTAGAAVGAAVGAAAGGAASTYAGSRRRFALYRSGDYLEKHHDLNVKNGSKFKKSLTRGSRAGALAGLAAGAISAAKGIKARHEKTAAAKPVLHKGQHLMPKGAPIPAGAKDVSPRAVAKARAIKGGKAAAVVGGVAALAAAAKHRMEKKASEKKPNDHVSVAKAAIAGAGAAGLRRYAKDGKTALRGLRTQVKYIAEKGGRIGPIDVHMALKSLAKPMDRRARLSGLKGGALAAAAAVGINKLKDHRKANLQKQAETVGSQGDREMKKVVASKGKQGNTSLQPGADKKPVKTPTKSKNPLAKQAAEMIERNGVKHRKGTPGSAAAIMGGVSGGLTAAANLAAYKTAKKHALGEVISRRTILKGVPQQAAYNAAIGYAYGKIRSHFRKKRGEVDTSRADFAKLKAGK